MDAFASSGEAPIFTVFTLLNF